jgi:hypothetical protein
VPHWTTTISEARRSRAASAPAARRRVDDLAVVDALEVDRRDAKVRVAEPALDDVERDALARHVDGVRVAQLVRGDASPDTSRHGEPLQRRADGRGRPWSAGGRAVDDAQQSAEADRAARLAVRRRCARRLLLEIWREA